MKKKVKMQPIIYDSHISNKKEEIIIKNIIHSCFENNINDWIPCRNFLVVNNNELKNNKTLFTFKFFKIFYLELKKYSE
jgi:hypothetical protein